MSDLSPVLDLPLLAPSQAQKHVTHNEALLALEAVIQIALEEVPGATPPALPEPGARYVVGTGATGAWAGQEGTLTLHDGSAWRFYTPRAGWRAQVPSTGQVLMFDGSAWQDVTPSFDDLEGIGIGATADSTNRLIVTSASTLLTHEGNGHQVKINKAATADTASLLYQTNWSGRAEVGLNGSDALSVKVSSDGSAWTEALSLDPASGHVTGAAIQSAATDVTAGRLMRADYGYGPGNLLGTVSEASGVPTGSVIERGSNANGSYVRFADGTQICTQVLDLDDAANDNVRADWTFPATFIADPMVMSAAPLAGADFENCSPRDFGLFRHGTGLTTNTVLLTGLGTLATDAAVRNMQCTAIGRWF